MQIEIQTKSYNPRRYGKPWVAIVDFSQSPRGEYTFGDWVGNPGEPGFLIINAEVGDIICVSQKDYRKPRNTVYEYYEVQEGGELIEIENKGDAYKRYRQTHK